jgi:hypothetical protein
MLATRAEVSVGFALQGRGAHAAFAGGTLDRMLRVNGADLDSAPPTASPGR